MHIENLREEPVKTQKAKRGWRYGWIYPILFGLFIMIGTWGTLMWIAASKNPGFYNNPILDAIDRTVENNAPKTVHVIFRDVFSVFVQSEQKIREAQAELRKKAAEGDPNDVSVKAMDKTAGFLDSWIIIAGIVGTAFAFVIKILLNIFVH